MATRAVGYRLRSVVLGVGDTTGFVEIVLMLALVHLGEDGSDILLVDLGLAGLLSVASDVRDEGLQMHVLVLLAESGVRGVERGPVFDVAHEVGLLVLAELVVVERLLILVDVGLDEVQHVVHGLENVAIDRFADERREIGINVENGDFVHDNLKLKKL